VHDVPSASGRTAVFVTNLTHSRRGIASEELELATIAVVVVAFHVTTKSNAWLEDWVELV
jgi:hypothetical protein